MTANTMKIQTVHGITCPVVSGRSMDENEEPPEPKQYRDETAKRLETVS